MTHEQRAAFLVLGLEVTKDTARIRKAYAEKLKICHPEEHPEAWQALHRAFHAALRYAEGAPGRRPELPVPEPPAPKPWQEPPDMPDFSALLKQSDDRIRQSGEETAARLEAWLREGKIIRREHWETLFYTDGYASCRAEAQILQPLLQLIERKQFTEESLDPLLEQLRELDTETVSQQLRPFLRKQRQRLERVVSWRPAPERYRVRWMGWKNFFCELVFFLVFISGILVTLAGPLMLLSEVYPWFGIAAFFTGPLIVRLIYLWDGKNRMPRCLDPLHYVVSQLTHGAALVCRAVPMDLWLPPLLTVIPPLLRNYSATTAVVALIAFYGVLARRAAKGRLTSRRFMETMNLSGIYYRNRCGLPVEARKRYFSWKWLLADLLELAAVFVTAMYAITPLHSTLISDMVFFWEAGLVVSLVRRAVKELRARRARRVLLELS